MPRIARLYSLLLLISKFTLPLSAALPELSSIEPLEFDEAAQRLIARGDARLDFQDTRLNADHIVYYQEYSLADALGNVAVLALQAEALVGMEIPLDRPVTALQLGNELLGLLPGTGAA